jgi:hypothetical protein
MKTYVNQTNQKTYWYFYDPYLKSWTVFEVDENENQISDADYFGNKENLLKCYDFDFKKTL